MTTRIRVAVAIAALLGSISAAAADPDPRIRTVVVGLQARRGVEDKALAAALSDVVQTAFARDRSRLVIGPDEIARVLAWEADRQTAGCDDSGCLAEIGAALDAARIVTGSLDRLGDGYLVVITEIDAKNAEPIGRVQEQAPADENELVAAVDRLAEALVAQARARGVPGGGGGFAQAGSIDVTSDPRGAQVFVGGVLMGSTPLKVDNLKTGAQRLRVMRADYDTVEIDVPVYAGGTTNVSAELRVHRSLAEQNFAMRKARRDEEQGWKSARMWTGLGAGACATTAGTAVGAANLLFNGGAIPLAIVSTGVGVLGLGLLGWGAVEALSPVPEPIPEWETPRQVKVTPPAGQGEVVVRELNLQPAAPSTAAY